MVLWAISRVLRITSTVKHVIVGGVEWLLRPFELDPNTHTFPRLVDPINTLAVSWRTMLGMKVKGKRITGCPACFIILLLYLVTVQSFGASLETSPEKDWKTVIENAPPGSKILMRGGIYTGFCNVNVPNNVVLKGESNTTSPVVIDCQSTSRHFTVPSGSKCHLEDIALVNGRAGDWVDVNGRGDGDGGCILVDGGGAELSLVRVTLKNCKATNYGGSISLVSSTAKIENSDIIDSEAWEGGGIFADRSLVIIVDTSITFNTALYMGGGIRALQASTLIARGSRTTISHNIGSGINEPE